MNIKRKKSLTGTILLFTAVLAVAGCGDPLLMGGAGYYTYGVVQGDDVNIVAKSYAAADYIDQQMRGFVKRTDTVRAMPFYTPPVADQDGEAELTTILPFQIGSRLHQIGYRMDLSRVSETPDIIPSAIADDDARFVLSGTFQYRPRKLELYRDLDVTVSVVDTISGRKIASFGYILPSNRRISNLSTPPKKHEPVMLPWLTGTTAPDQPEPLPEPDMISEEGIPIYVSLPDPAREQ